MSFPFRGGMFPPAIARRYFMSISKEERVRMSMQNLLRYYRLELRKNRQKKN